jgi:hypothetical protein|tara:strand:- start:356 stop:517 length:162 start_codon:yes stop_codon:yes gene_type:complete
MKKYHYTKLSSKYKCRICGKNIKLNLIARKKYPPQLCYIHWIAKKLINKGEQI